MSTPQQVQTDGLAERSIGTVIEALRLFCCYDSTFDVDGTPVDWITVLHALEYAYNSTEHSVTGYAPFILERAQIPRGLIDVLGDLSGLATPRSALMPRTGPETLP